MNAEELKVALQEFYDDDQNKKIGVTVYAVLKDVENPGPFKLDIEDVSSVDLKKLFIQSLEDSISNKSDLALLPISQTDERTDAIYLYDLEVPKELLYLQDVIKKNSFISLKINEENLYSIKNLLILIGNNERQLVLYKKMYPINIFGRKSFFLIKHESRLTHLKDEFLRISPGFEIMQINEDLLILDLNELEKSLGFHEVIKSEARKGVQAIEEIELLDNPDVLYELLDDIKYARKLTKVATASPILLKGISKNEIVHFCKTHTSFAGGIKFTDEDKIILDTKKSKDWFIKLLMDDFLTSELTKEQYISAAKDSIN